MANRKCNIQMNFYVTENKKQLIDERIKLLASLPYSMFIPVQAICFALTAGNQKKIWKLHPDRIVH